ncbi:AIPR family protein [Bradyrhizobium japonicum]|uniref:AIPR family protein n=1 Tax=Bradyrhizobium japonicum TaxID=375 RepID=UPI002714CF20|nr:AIPR family protein [Bradyrhizobium japonicum]WLB55492.1 AIPR family protein [Bradyrhizobium japonicum]WLB62631.1 AIPR family protein [Bradyrhizobium japonicum]
MAKKINLSSLLAEVKEVHEQFPNWTTDNAFVHWFFQAFLVADSEIAARSVTGVSHDKGVDGIYLDESSKQAFLVQGKLRQAATPPLEPRVSVMGFAAIAKKIVSPKAEFASFKLKMDPLVASKISDVRERVLKRGFSLSLYYVTTGKCSGPLKAEAESEASQANARVSIKVLERADVLALLTDYLGGAAPPVPYLDLRVDARGVMGSDGMIQRYDSQTGIESWILTMSARDIGELYVKAGDRLFARNIRGFLGDTAINDGIKSTLRDQPEDFWYFNNGVTIVCNSARKTSERAQSVLRLTNPQVINGQQTTRTLSTHGGRRAAVLVRVISVPRDPDKDQTEFESLVSNIVAATNWQNAILPSDLRANDSRQVILQRDLAKLRYHYLRKRQSRQEARRVFGRQYGFWLKMDELAQLVAACEFDPYLVRSGKQGLFDPPLYGKIFDGRSVSEYLSIYWFGKMVKRQGSGYPDRAYAKWHAMNFLWSHVAPLLRRKSTAEEFRRRCETREGWPPLERAASEVFKALGDFFKANRGVGQKATDISNFFYRPHQEKAFEKYWASRRNTRRLRVKRYLQLFEEGLQTSD